MENKKVIKNENIDSENIFHSLDNNCSLSTLTLAEVGVKIKIKDVEAIKRWLKNNNITIHKFSKTNYVYQIDVDCVIDKVRARELMKQYPNNWQAVYRKIVKNNDVYEMVVLSLTGVLSIKPTTRIKPVNKSETELYKRYSK